MAIVERAPSRVDTVNKYLPEIEVTELPSAGMVYPVRGIYYHPYTFGEIKKLSMDSTPILKKYEYIMNGISVSGFDKFDLTLSDVLFIALLRKLSLPGVESIIINTQCSNCREKISKLYPLSSIEFDDLKVKSPISVTVDEVKYSFSPMTIGRMLALIQEYDEPSDNEMLAYMCTSHDPKIMVKILDDLSNTRSFVDDDVAVLNTVDSYMYHGIMPVKVECDKCHHINSVEIDDGEDEGVIVLPFLPNKATLKDRIEFGK